MKKLYIYILFFLPYIVISQQELGLHFMRPTYQSNITNPAFFMKQKVAVTMPSLYYNYGNTSFSSRKVISRDSVIDLNLMTDKVKDYNYLMANMNILPLSVGVRINDLQIGLTTGFRSFVYGGYNKNMFIFLTQGNKDFIDKKINLAPDIQVNMFGEIGLSGAYRFLDKHLSVGISGKYLMGFADISTSRKNREISIYTNPDIYQLEMTTNYQLNSSAKGSLISQLPFSNDSLPIHNTGKNNGFALDIGAEYIINDKISVAASVIDIGSITWRENINSYKSEGKYTYQGVDVASLVLQDSSIGFDAITDTLKKSFNFERIENKSYKTPLNTQFYLSTTYRPIPILRVGGLFYGTFLYGKLQPSIAISGNVDLKKWFSIGIVA
ncbi:MAG: DUF5723 family protein, partial [Cetobacterium sp.]